MNTQNVRRNHLIIIERAGNSLDTEYLIALIGVGGTVLGFLLNEISTNIKRKNDVKERFLLANYSHRQQAYAQLNYSLITYREYFEKFTNYGNELMEHYEPEEFAPLSELTDIKKEFDKIEIWLLGETVDLMNSIFAYSSLLCGLAIVIIEDKARLAAVEESADTMLGRIDLVRKHIKEVMGMEDLDKHQETLINTKIDAGNSV